MDYLMKTIFCCILSKKRASKYPFYRGYELAGWKIFWMISYAIAAETKVIKMSAEESTNMFISVNYVSWSWIDTLWLETRKFIPVS